MNGIKGGLDEWLNRIDNCWQFRSRQLSKTLITSFLRPVCSHEATGTTRFEGVFRLGLIEVSDFCAAALKMLLVISRCERGCARLSISLARRGKVSRNVAFQLPERPDKRNHGLEINFSIPYLDPFALLCRPSPAFFSRLRVATSGFEGQFVGSYYWSSR